MKNKYVFDLDNTLVFTDNLNNLAYNLALEHIGFSPIVNQKRITRDILNQVYPCISTNTYNAICKLKQEYFINQLEHTILNKDLLDFICLTESDNCILWTSAEQTRVEAILDYYNIRKLFKAIVFSEKKDISSDIKLFCNILKCDFSELVFYEDNREIISELLALDLCVVIVNDSLKLL